jgi:hypothetical protein
MPRPEFATLERALIAANVAPRFVRRTIQELSEHLEDIETDALAAGLSRAEARSLAREAIGSDCIILAAVTARDELRDWHCRWPRSAATLRLLSWTLLLPGAPLAYCARHGGTIFRWSASASLGTLLTAAMLFSMQLALA